MPSGPRPTSASARAGESLAAKKTTVGEIVLSCAIALTQKKPQQLPPGDVSPVFSCGCGAPSGL